MPNIRTGASGRGTFNGVVQKYVPPPIISPQLFPENEHPELTSPDQLAAMGYGSLAPNNLLAPIQGPVDPAHPDDIPARSQPVPPPGYAPSDYGYMPLSGDANVQALAQSQQPLPDTPPSDMPVPLPPPPDNSSDPADMGAPPVIGAPVAPQPQYPDITPPKYQDFDTTQVAPITPPTPRTLPQVNDVLEDKRTDLATKIAAIMPLLGLITGHRAGTSALAGTMALNAGLAGAHKATDDDYAKDMQAYQVGTQADRSSYADALSNRNELVQNLTQKNRLIEQNNQTEQKRYDNAINHADTQQRIKDARQKQVEQDAIAQRKVTVQEAAPKIRTALAMLKAGSSGELTPEGEATLASAMRNIGLQDLPDDFLRDMTPRQQEQLAIAKMGPAERARHDKAMEAQRADQFNRALDFKKTNAINIEKGRNDRAQKARANAVEVAKIRKAASTGKTKTSQYGLRQMTMLHTDINTSNHTITQLEQLQQQTVNQVTNLMKNPNMTDSHGLTDQGKAAVALQDKAYQAYDLQIQAERQKLIDKQKAFDDASARALADVPIDEEDARRLSQEEQINAIKRGRQAQDGTYTGGNPTPPAAKNGGKKTGAGAATLPATGGFTPARDKTFFYKVTGG